ncbi:MAG: hypothetical protein IKS69_00515 [Erysipelotrichaceae bacterium]|nr:hypothetical protein [Erysipelotrichaceae bacterium]
MFVKYIPDGFWSSKANGLYPSHEAICVINPYEEAIVIHLTLYFEDRDKMDGFAVRVEAERTLHIRMDKIMNDRQETVPQDVPYAIRIECEKEIPIQYSRMDTSQAEMGLCTTIV